MLSLLIADSSARACSELEAFCLHTSTIQLLPSVHNGQDLLHVLQAEKVDILIMDIVLPVLDGLGVLTYIDDMPEEQKPAVFVHTAFLDNRLLHELQRLQVVYCFVKPMEPAYIMQRVMQLMLPYGQPADPAAATVQAPTLPSSSSDADDAAGDISAEITKQIRAVGIPAHLRGYHYLRAAIQFSVDAKDPSSIAITKDIYPMIAEQFHTRPSLVERSIRNAIEVAWTRGNPRVLQQYFGYSMEDFKGKPSNAEFIAMIADRIRVSR